MSYVLFGILFYLIYRFVAGFILPVARTTRQFKQQFNNMKERAEEQQASEGTRYRNNPQVQTEKPKYDIEGEYIQFEETKE